MRERHFSALQEAQDIFGVDFDFDEFSKYQDDYDEDMEEEDVSCYSFVAIFVVYSL